MKKNYFSMVSVIMLLLFILCSCNSGKTKKLSLVSKNQTLLDFTILTQNDFDNKSFDDEITQEVANETKFLHDDCSDILNIVYQKLSVNSSKEYIESLHYLYESVNQQDLEKRRKSHIGISIPDFGTLNWSSNKNSVKKIYDKYKQSGDYSLQTDEQIELFYVFSRSEDVQKAINAWTVCKSRDIPILTLDYNIDTALSVSFTMRPNDYRDANDKVRVTDIIFSPNLELINGNIKGKKIRYRGTHTLQFIRKDLKEAFVRVSLEEGFIGPLEIPKISKEPVYELRPYKDIIQYSFIIDYRKGILTITDTVGNNQEITFTKDKKGSGYLKNLWFSGIKDLNFNVKTNLNVAEATITDYFYSPTYGGIRTFEKKGIKLEDNGTLSLDCYISRTDGKPLGSKTLKMEGKFIIIYGGMKKVCVANCEEK